MEPKIETVAAVMTRFGGDVKIHLSSLKKKQAENDPSEESIINTAQTKAAILRETSVPLTTWRGSSGFLSRNLHLMRGEASESIDCYFIAPLAFRSASDLIRNGIEAGSSPSQSKAYRLIEGPPPFCEELLIHPFANAPPQSRAASPSLCQLMGHTTHKPDNGNS
ncbi:hypothetical protein P175DRAFT_0527693 [Aspergillus ochraceoroseus IBT 24754]|uniref:Uncharacterized protein n=1 Tax=Aspergillus ochraceoroseus IBT 24754 TaxID=1392256 RepID=A0A2T5M6T9_9EURO|nr:uncharacterized protein P175DRAFT_0527693 [Aspergillus ochraceoroseus IBT 24754]PTU24244.1 hypothetical protein P175DRAFT_0527693 [Aspergillus ochraceoroseus IBT 24754]